MENSQRIGVLSIIAACVIWGFAPLYYTLLSDLPAGDVLAHRIFWSMVVFLVFLGVTGRLGQLRATVSSKREFGWISIAAIMVSVNWFLFIVAVMSERVTSSSLAYFIAPLVSVLLGVVVFREGPTPLQWLAIALATLAVLTLSFGLGAPPVLSLVMATTFGIYGAVKKMVSASGSVSVTLETIVVLPIVLTWLVFFAETPVRLDWTFVLLVLSGPITAVPLVLFSVAAQKIPMPTLGILQYINPSLQFLCALAILGEPMTRWHAIAFPMIWVALAIYSVSTFKRRP